MTDAEAPTPAPTRSEEDTMDSETLSFRTGGEERVLDITRDCADFASGRGDGLLHLFVPHATAGIAIIETGAGSDDDLLEALADLLPADDRWQHRHGSPGHGRSHVMPALVPPYATVPVLGGQLALGTWQSICLVDLNIDNAVRDVRLSFLAG
jgi:secondary thiamine-phosphate synthase enzyme